MSTEVNGKMVPVQTDDYQLTKVATGVPCFVDDCIRLGDDMQTTTRFLDGGIAPSHSSPIGCIIHSNRAGVDKKACLPSDFGLVWLKKS